MVWYNNEIQQYYMPLWFGILFVSCLLNCVNCIIIQRYVSNSDPVYTTDLIWYRVSVCCLTPLFSNFSAISWREQVTFQWDDEEVCPSLYSTNTLSWIVYSASSQKHTLFWFRDNQFLLFLLNAACLAEKQQIPIL
jgi:hypothetical protein